MSRVPSPAVSFRDSRLPERFWAKVDLGPLWNGTPCWLWTGAPNNGGYGSCRWEGKLVGTHRLAYEVLVGPISYAMEPDHLCRVRLCVNPEHMEPVTRAENIRRGYAQKAPPPLKSHCLRGHPFTEANTRLYGRRRYCRECGRTVHKNLKGNAPSTRTSCPQGHPYDEENTYIYKGGRHCRACRRARGLRNYYLYYRKPL